MIIENNKSLSEYTTFAVEVSARYFAEITSVVDMKKLIEDNFLKDHSFYILGQGSNILFTQDYKGLIIYNQLQGKKIISENDEYCLIEIASGESWHDFVMWSVERNLWGIENLALIPGTIGASAVQNIGAYGVEAQESIHQVLCLDIESGEEIVLPYEQCQFGYRESIFKQQPNRYFITGIQFKLSKIPRINIEYGAIVDRLAQENITNPTAQDMAKIVISLRNSKLPTVGEIGMAGSFFKNPVISYEHLEQLKKDYPEIKYFALENGMVKIPAGWIIEVLGYKGAKEGNVGTYQKHALVLVNYGGATGSEVWEFAQKIMLRAKMVFNISLEPEVIIL